MIKPTENNSDAFLPYSADVDLWFEFNGGKRVPISQIGRGKAFLKELELIDEDLGNEACLCISIDGKVKRKDVVISKNGASSSWVSYQAIDQLPF